VLYVQTGILGPIDRANGRGVVQSYEFACSLFSLEGKVPQGLPATPRERLTPNRRGRDLPTRAGEYQEPVELTARRSRRDLFERCRGQLFAEPCEALAA